MVARLFFLAAFGLGLSAPLAVSATYTQEVTAVDFGGGASTSVNYAHQGSLGAGGAVRRPAGRAARGAALRPN